MKNLIAYFRGLVSLKKAVAQNTEHAAFLDAVKQSNPKKDKLEVTRYRCTIDEEWIDRIDEGLEAIAKAIAEERQFILSNGEIVPIEKIKHVSKDSVSHLAKHSNLITKMPEEDEDLMPEKLYTVERYNDYAVYENRFLYMLLRYINDFVSIRYEDIVKYCSSYYAILTMDKSAEKPGRKLAYATTLVEQRTDDKFLLESSDCKQIIDKINVLLKKVSVQLSTPLMQEVAKVAMLKPPVTKTNVLKMDRNFKAAFALYSFIISYKGQGYEVEEVKTVMNPFSEDASDDFAQGIMMSSFVAYEHGLGLQRTIKNRYELDEKERIDKEFFEKLERLKKRVKESGCSLEEYAILLEERNKKLEKDNEELVSCKQKIAKQKEKIDKLNLDIATLSGEVESLRKEIENSEAKHREQIEALNAQHEANLKAQQDKFASEKQALFASFEAQKAQINQKHSQELAQRDKSESALKEQIRQNALAFEKEKQAIDDKHAEKVRELNDVIESGNAQIDALKEQIVLLNGQITAIKAQKGLIGKDEDFTSKERYDELENQIRVLKKIYAEEWKKVKKKIKEEKGLYALTLKGEKEKMKAEKEDAKAQKARLKSEKQAKRLLAGNEDLTREVQNASDAQPVDMQTIETQNVGAQPVETQTTEVKSVEEQPIEAQPTEVKAEASSVNAQEGSAASDAANTPESVQNAVSTEEQSEIGQLEEVI